MSLSYKRRKKTLSREQRHTLTKDTIGQTCPHVDKIRLKAHARKLWRAAKLHSLRRRLKQRDYCRNAARSTLAEINTLSPVAREY